MLLVIFLIGTLSGLAAGLALSLHPYFRGRSCR